LNYDAFISYSHAADGRLAPKVQSGLHRFAKPLLRLRALHVFRDQTSLSATPELWSTIESALNGARFFVFMASPDAAASVWVQREVEHWLTASPMAKTGKAVDHFLVILTDGDIVWDPQVGDFDWEQTTALPRQLSRAFAEEPLFVDMRAVKDENDLSLHNSQFRNQIADLAATIHGRPKDELIGEDVRIVRRNRRLAWSAGIGLAALAIAASIMAYVATVQRDAARSRESAALATSQLGVDPHKSLLLAIQGVTIAWTAEAASALREALIRSHRRAVLRSNGPVSEAHFSPTGTRILGTVCSQEGLDCVQQLWETNTGQPICSLPAGEQGRFSSDGAYIVTGAGKVFDAETCRPVPKDPSTVSLVRTDSPRYEVAYDGDVPVIRHIGSGKVLRTLSSHLDPIAAAVFSKDNRYAVTWSKAGMYSESGGGPTEIGDKSARIWGVKYSDADAVLAGHDRAINAAAFGPDAQFIVTGSEDRTTRIWLTASGEQFKVLRGLQDAVEAVAVSPDGSLVLSIDRKGRAWLWEAGTTAPARQTYRDLFALRYGVRLPDLEGEDQPIELPKLSVDGRTIAALVSTTRIAVWDRTTGKRRALLTDHSYGSLQGWPSPDGERIVTKTGWPNVACCDDFALVWDVTSGKVIKKLAGHKGPVYNAAYSPDGSFIATVSDDGTARLWDAASCELLKVIDVGGGRVLGGAFSSDGSRLVTVSRDSIARIWDMQTGGLIHELFGHEGGVVGAAFSPDDTLVATVGDDYTRVWDAGTGKQLGAYLGSNPEPIFFARDCSKLVIGANAESEVRVHPFGACGSHDQLLAAAMERTRLITYLTN
jgi:WD40 repeat protein